MSHFVSDAKVLLVIAFVAALLFWRPVHGHDAPSGWAYDPECCGGYDCAAAVDGAVREEGGGYRVTVLPGTHPMVQAGSQPVTGFVPYGDRRIRPSGDAHRHVCIVGGNVYCIYIPPGGV